MSDDPKLSPHALERLLATTTLDDPEGLDALAIELARSGHGARLTRGVVVAALEAHDPVHAAAYLNGFIAGVTGTSTEGVARVELCYGFVLAVEAPTGRMELEHTGSGWAMRMLDGEQLFPREPTDDAEGWLLWALTGKERPQPSWAEQKGAAIGLVQATGSDPNEPDADGVTDPAGESNDDTATSEDGHRSPTGERADNTDEGEVAHALRRSRRRRRDRRRR